MTVRILSWRDVLPPPEPVVPVTDTRWHVCCRSCRRGDHAAAGCAYKDSQCSCPRCVDRTQETFSEPHPDDWKATEETSERA